MPITREQVNTDVDNKIRNKTALDKVSNVDDANNRDLILDYIDEQSLGFKVYSVLVSQSGTNAPILKQLKNTTGVTFTTAFTSTGTFMLTGSSNVFTTDKTATIKSFNSNGSYPNGTMDFYSLGAQFFQIETRNSGTLTNGIITDSFIEIRIYP